MRSVVATAALLGLVVFAVGCGQSNGRKPPLGRSANGVSAVGGQQMVDAQVALARCMRRQGIDMPDPGAGGRTEFDPAAGGVDPSRLSRAEKHCKREQRAVAASAPRSSPQAREADQEATLRFARCMRRHGQDVPDPQTGPQGGSAVAVPPGSRENPAFLAAQKKCESLLRLPGPEGP